MKFFIQCLILVLLGQVTVYGQRSKPTPPEGSTKTIVVKPDVQINSRPQGLPSQNSIFDQTPAVDYRNISSLPLAISGQEQLQLFRAPKSGMTTWIKGQLKNTPTTTLQPEAKIFNYLNEVKSTLQITAPSEEFTTKSSQTDAQQQLHTRMQQVYKGIKVYGSEIILHEKEGAIYLFNGHYFPTPQLEVLTPSLNAQQASEIVKDHLGQTTAFLEIGESKKRFIAGEQIQSELVIYHHDGNLTAERLVWHITAIPNLSNRWEYFVDAQDGSILHEYNNICKLHGWHPEHQHLTESPIKSNSKPTAELLPPPGPVTATDADLFGINRTINVWLEGSTYYMIDASRSMFNASASNIPESAVGVIATFDAQNIWPTGPGANVVLKTSGSNNWGQKEVSAHYNAGIAFEYFKNTFGRNSIKDEGENIFSIVNVPDEDGSAFDNAFWNGEAMFYGNGAQSFNAPLAKALDVAGHEMSHGVVQSTANLAYQSESGALNESFADIFGAMIDRNDWKIGEEIANPSVFPSGTMRDMENPNNGGNSNNFYWQPDKYSDRYTGSQDNGGVHINSGIPNHAYYLFATNGSVGKAKAEKIYYKALTDYLVMSSKFVDLRIAVLQAAADIHGANSSEFNAAAAAFDQVEIFGTQGGNYQNDVNANPGDEFIVWSDNNSSDINNSLPQNGNFQATFSTDNHISKASVSDDGSIIVYVDSNKNLREVDVDWSTGSPNIGTPFTLNSSLDWRNIVTSKDGTKIAAVYGDLSQSVFDNEIFVFDFNSGTSQWFVLKNPTFTQGVSTGDVQYADALEWDISGQYILYDAFNEIANSQGEDISYWDIGIVKVWDNGSDSFEDAQDPTISKLFNNIPDNVSIGNPTFAKNSPYVIAFDYIESTFSGAEYSVRGVNIQTGDQGVIFNNNTLGYPSYSVQDDRVLFSVINSGQDILGYRDLNSNKISGTGDAFILIENARWGAYYAIGDRDLTATENLSLSDEHLKIFPNPLSDQLNIEFDASASADLQVGVFDLLGKAVHNKQFSVQQGTNQLTLNLGHLPKGTYALRLVYRGELMSQIITKF